MLDRLQRLLTSDRITIEFSRQLHVDRTVQYFVAVVEKDSYDGGRVIAEQTGITLGQAVFDLLQQQGLSDR